MTGKLGSKALSKELAKLAQEAWGTAPDGTPMTNEQRLAKMIWQQALGWVELEKDKETGKLVAKQHPPVAWCQQFLYERLEGKASQAAPENANGIKAADKVSELAKNRLNQLAKAKQETVKS